MDTRVMPAYDHGRGSDRLRPTHLSSIQTKSSWGVSMRANRLSAACVIALFCIALASRSRAETRRHAKTLSQRQSAEHLAAGGIDDCVGDAVFGCVQQPRDVRSRKTA